MVGNRSVFVVSFPRLRVPCPRRFRTAIPHANTKSTLWNLTPILILTTHLEVDSRPRFAGANVLGNGILSKGWGRNVIDPGEDGKSCHHVCISGPRTQGFSYTVDSSQVSDGSCDVKRNEQGQQR